VIPVILGKFLWRSGPSEEAIDHVERETYPGSKTLLVEV